MTLQIKICTYQNIHVATNFRAIYKLQSCRKKRNIVAIEICLVDRKVCCGSNYLNVCSIFNTMSQHSGIIVTTHFFNQLESGPVKCRDIKKNVATLFLVIQFEIVSQHSNFVS